MTSMSTATLEQPIAQQREIARLFVPKFPIPMDVVDRERNAAWHNWLLHVRKFAVLNGIKAVDRPCRIRATVRRWEGGRIAGVSWADKIRWENGLEDALVRSIVPQHLLWGVRVEYMRLAPDTDLLDRPRLEGVEIVIYEEDQ